MGELEVGCAWTDGRWVYGGVVEVPWVCGCGIGGCGVAVPVVGYFVVVHDVDPGEVFGDGGPVGGIVDLAVFAAVSFWVAAKAAGDIDVDEVTEEEHEGGF